VVTCHIRGRGGWFADHIGASGEYRKINSRDRTYVPIDHGFNLQSDERRTRLRQSSANRFLPPLRWLAVLRATDPGLTPGATIFRAYSARGR
ncbi:MAG: hypothetical protein M3Y84_01950, partial [Acidobacteriota bacterium]|nr:hypothetical protein [Acidobacteriota bacterium]